MAGSKHKNVFRAIAEPFVGQEPLLIRFCRGLVDNLTTILRTALVFGAVVLLQDLRDFVAETAPPVADVTPVLVAPVEVEAPVPPSPVMTESVEMALKCTYTEFRNDHYDECVKDDSRVYKRPGADPDDTGQVFEPPEVLFAGVLRVTNEG